MSIKPLILVTNDDGYQAGGIKALTETVRPLGDVLVVAPTEGQSGMSHAMTVKVPLRLEKRIEQPGFTLYTCNGTPTDCVKIALNRLINRHPDLLLAGINHGSNSSSSVLYSGTMAAAMEGCLYNIPGIGFSLTDHSSDADFMPYMDIIRKMILAVSANGLQKGVCLNVNIPRIPVSEIKGIRVCRQTKGYWNEEFERHIDPANREYFWLTGNFVNEEPCAEDTDEWALSRGYIAIVPVQIDMTAYDSLPALKKLFRNTLKGCEINKL
ncbi:MAG: 5'/3'-nucleotidase SurE [Bacteroidales bacterium]|jgi:5'-nucleotidase|nr:5'/3'-nucleotidase SurE [Bacteroidales bacterium]